MVKNYFKLMFAVLFATNVMAQRISCTLTGEENYLTIVGNKKINKNNGFNQIKIDRFGRIYFQSGYGIYVLNKNIIKQIDGIYLDGHFLKLDPKKNFIFCNGTSGKIYTYKESLILLKQGLDFTNAFDRNVDGELWFDYSPITTYSSKGLTRDSDLKSFSNTNSNILNGRIKLINCDNKGNIWILLDSGLSKFDGVNFINYTSSNSKFPSVSPTTFICDSIGNLWFGGENGITKFDGVNWISYNSSNSTLLNNSVTDISLDNDYTSIWIGTVDGISRVDRSGNWENYNSINSNLPSKLYRLSMSADTSGNLWFSNEMNGISVLCKKINYNILNSSIQKELVCKDKIILQSPKEGAKFYWSTGDTVVDLKVTKAGNYSVLIYDSLGCPYSKSITVNSDEFSVGTPSICMVTTENSATKLIWSQTTSNIVSKYNIYRQSSENSTYEKIHEQKLDVLSEYIDNGTNPNIKTYRYKISYVDTCGNETPLSGNHATILLSSNVGINGTVNLFWNPYEGFTYPNFEIWRSTDGVNFIKIGAVANNSYAYIDNNAPTQAWYQIRITKQDACIATKRGENYVGSNIISKEGKSLYINEQKNEAFTVYPNPTKDLIIINNANGNTIRITDLQGKEVYNALATSAKTEISLKSIGAKGMYILHIVDEKGVSIENKKIVLE